MKVEQVDISSITPHDRNPRRHPEAQVSEMLKSIKLFGQTRPIIVDESGIILTGHCIRLACLQGGIDKVFIRRIAGLTDSQKLTLIISDNKLAEMGLDDNDAVMDIIRSIDTFEIPGFDGDVLKEVLSSIETAVQDYGKVDASDVQQGGVPFFEQKEKAPEAPPQTLSDVAGTVATAGNPESFKLITCPHCGKEIRI